MQSHFHTIIVGAGLSGIGAAYYHQTNRPDKSYAILEGRSAMGGTWDLFRYPGVRSDSDMYTLGFSFNPWNSPNPVAEGHAILEYLKETANRFEITPKIQFNSKVISAEWSDSSKQYTLKIKNPETTEIRKLSCNFLIMCSGYYNYKQGHNPALKGENNFKGKVVHPQKWDTSIDYSNKKIVIIGSGATAVTLLPALQKTAASITMLQRSPTFIYNLNTNDKTAKYLRKILPRNLLNSILRMKYILMATVFYKLSRNTPNTIRKYLQRQAKKILGKQFKKSDFDPNYQPWDQRVCIIPDGDFYKALTASNANIVTDKIHEITATGIQLISGKSIEADIIIKATGLRLQFFGGMSLKINGKPTKAADLFMHRGTMFSGIPNLAVIIGYTNITWTLKCELTLKYIMKLLNHMDSKEYIVCTPQATSNLKKEPLFNLNSGYINRVQDKLPHQGNHKEWKLYQNYFKDKKTFRNASLEDDSLVYQKKSR